MGVRSLRMHQRQRHPQGATPRRAAWLATEKRVSRSSADVVNRRVVADRFDAVARPLPHGRGSGGVLDRFLTGAARIGPALALGVRIGLRV